MIDPVLQHLYEAKQTAAMIAQLMRLDPDLMLPAALPLLASRLMGADGFDDDSDPELTEPSAGLAAG